MNKEVSKYISKFPKKTQTILRKIYTTIQITAPKSEDNMFYGVPNFKLNGKNLVQFAAFKKHIGFYPMPNTIKIFQKELLKYKTSEGTIKFPLDKPIPYPLIKKIVEFRVKELN